jgi:amphi-Trp domain-containing protein
MGEKTVLMDVKETMLRYDVAVMLRNLADDLAQGRITAAEGDVEVGGTLKVECKGKSKPKEDGTKTSIKIELSWCGPSA